eukprot:TRINITY_DN1518_c0_g1_i2.p1 TRINITY_DN1518_c0_g1~~TRINITY_DN1518_c0_g1_i2.p1  ORF type:complete len:978 (-),score=278.43 TRINITY_DN1518_c0_g1_i2:91-3024(-)
MIIRQCGRFWKQLILFRGISTMPNGHERNITKARKGVKGNRTATREQRKKILLRPLTELTLKLQKLKKHGHHSKSGIDKERENNHTKDEKSGKSNKKSADEHEKKAKKSERKKTGKKDTEQAAKKKETKEKKSKKEKTTKEKTEKKSSKEEGHKQDENEDAGSMKISEKQKADLDEESSTTGTTKSGSKKKDAPSKEEDKKKKSSKNKDSEDKKKSQKSCGKEEAEPKKKGDKKSESKKNEKKGSRAVSSEKSKKINEKAKKESTKKKSDKKKHAEQVEISENDKKSGEKKEEQGTEDVDKNETKAVAKKSDRKETEKADLKFGGKTAERETKKKSDKDLEPQKNISESSEKSDDERDEEVQSKGDNDSEIKKTEPDSLEKTKAEIKAAKKQEREAAKKKKAAKKKNKPRKKIFRKEAKDPLLGTHPVSKRNRTKPGNDPLLGNKRKTAHKKDDTGKVEPIEPKQKKKTEKQDIEKETKKKSGPKEPKQNKKPDKQNTEKETKKKSRPKEPKQNKKPDKQNIENASEKEETKDKKLSSESESSEKDQNNTEGKNETKEQEQEQSSDLNDESEEEDLPEDGSDSDNIRVTPDTFGLSENAIDNAISTLAQHLVPADHKSLLKSYEQVITSEAIMNLILAKSIGNATSKSDAVKIASILFERKVFVGVKTMKQFKSKKTFYNTQWPSSKSYRETGMLVETVINTAKTCKPQTQPNAGILNKMFEQLTTLIRAHSKDRNTTNLHTCKVNITKLSAGAAFRKFTLLTAQLQNLSLKDIVSAKGRSAEIFFVNLHNILVIHALCLLRGEAKTMLDRKYIMEYCFYSIGGQLYSPSIIRDYILCASKEFPKTDERKQYCLQVSDPARLTWALSDATKSSPPIIFYKEANQFKKLVHRNVEGFLKDSVLLLEKEGYVEVPFFLKSYEKLLTATDKQTTSDQVLAGIRPHLSTKVEKKLAAVEHLGFSWEIRYTPRDNSLIFPLH